MASAEIGVTHLIVMKQNRSGCIGMQGEGTQREPQVVLVDYTDKKLLLWIFIA